MIDFLYNKIDFIIMIVLALLVAFIIGFGIIQVVDSKLSSVTINVPPQGCQLPPIYLNLDKKTSDIDLNNIKLNDVISTGLVNSNSTQVLNPNKIDETISDIDGFDNVNKANVRENFVQVNKINEVKGINETDGVENFGGIQDYPLLYDDNRRYLIADTIVPNQTNKIFDQKTKLEKMQDPNYSDLNHIPLLFAPDTDVPNRAGPDAIGYYSSKVKLVEDPNSPLMKLAKQNVNKVSQAIAKCSLANRNRVPEVNGTFDGYNAFADLRTDSFANITSIGKSMLAPYTSFPVPS